MVVPLLLVVPDLSGLEPERPLLTPVVASDDRVPVGFLRNVVVPDVELLDEPPLVTPDLLRVDVPDLVAVPDLDTVDEVFPLLVVPLVEEPSLDPLPPVSLSLVN